MANYRLYFMNHGYIELKLLLTAEGDADALWVAAQLRTACSDSCERIEVWSGETMVEYGFTPNGTELARARNEESVLLAKQAIFNGPSAIAKSRSLLASLQQADPASPGED
jgi:hypothetical protein